MSFDALENRKIAKTWKEYLGDSKMSLMVILWVWRELIGPRSKQIALRMVVAGLVATLLAIGQAWPFAWVINGVIARDLHRSLFGLAAFAACLLSSQLFAYWFMMCRERMIGENTTQRDRRMNQLFFAKSLGQHMRDGSALSVGGMEKAKGKVNFIQDMMIFNGLSAVLDLLVVYVFIWTISTVAALAMTLLVVLMILNALHLSQRCIEVCVPIEIDFSRYNRRQAELWEKVERVKTNGKEAEEIERGSAWSKDIFVRDFNFWAWFIRMSNWRGLVEKLVLVATIGYGVWRVWHGDWTLGLLYPLFSWCGMFANNLWRLASIERDLNWALPSVKAMKDALTMAPDVVDKSDATEIPSTEPIRIEFQAVGHTYTVGVLDGEEQVVEEDAEVLKNVSFTVEPGEKVALIGPSGAGKTTVMRLLQRYMDPDQGAVLVNGRDLRDVKLASWIQALAYIPQQAQILDGTIKSNLLYGLPEGERHRVLDENLWGLMGRLCIDFGRRLAKNKLETKVGRNGIKLSGGEAQRLMIGAAAMRKPRFMLIDEATSSLDSTTEKVVQRGLAEVLSGDMGALIIAHRLSTVRHLCTKFVVLKPSGSVTNGSSQVEAVAGSFEELYRLSPTFRQLAQDQGVAISKTVRPKLRRLRSLRPLAS
ncbi:ABC transporter ATP-binding protein [Candidatus Uhrbacteria bacterium]|nr:ABC transporter ATP-binding protein [Candidatus Uhrbacteria bacterium]